MNGLLQLKEILKVIIIIVASREGEMCTVIVPFLQIIVIRREKEAEISICLFFLNFFP